MGLHVLLLIYLFFAKRGFEKTIDHFHGGEREEEKGGLSEQISSSRVDCDMQNLKYMMESRYMWGSDVLIAQGGDRFKKPKSFFCEAQAKILKKFTHFFVSQREKMIESIIPSKRNFASVRFDPRWR
jgi:hypothetical protein